MKKYLSILMILSLFAYSCSDDDDNNGGITITLGEPADGTTVDLSNLTDGKLDFTWTADSDVPGGYTIVFSISQDMTSPQEVNSTTPSITMQDVTLDSKMAALGLGAGESGTVYWTVRPTAQSLSARIPSARSLKVTRINDPSKIDPEGLLAPAHNTPAGLLYTAPATTIDFKWDAVSGASQYEIVLSLNASLSNPILTKTVNTTQVSFTHDELQAVIENPASGMKRYLDNTVYWNVKAGSSNVSVNPAIIYLSGFKVFVDSRTGDPEPTNIGGGDGNPQIPNPDAGQTNQTVTYEVSVITDLEGKQTAWLATDLVAKRKTDGELVYCRETSNGYNSLSYAITPAYTGEYNKEAGTPIPTVVQQNTGFYYRNHDKVGDLKVGHLPELIPDGWRIPTATDWTNLYEAALAADGGAVVLRNPVCFPESEYPDNRSHYNAWNMNMVGNGYWKWTLWSFLNDPDEGGYSPEKWYYIYDDSGDYGKTVCFNGSQVLFEIPSSGWKYDAEGAAVRLIYNE